MGIFSSSPIDSCPSGGRGQTNLDLLKQQLALHNVLLTSAQSNRQESLAMSHLATVERLVELIVAAQGGQVRYVASVESVKRRRCDDADFADDADTADFADTANLGTNYANFGSTKRRCDRGSGRRGEKNGIDFDQYDRDPRCGEWMSAGNVDEWYADEDSYKEERKSDRMRIAENGHGYSTDDSFVVSDDLIEFEDESLDDESVDDESFDDASFDDESVDDESRSTE